MRPRPITRSSRAAALLATLFLTLPASAQQGLIERTIHDQEGNTLFSTGKSDCDSTRIDTLSEGRMMVEIRDFREGRIRSLERHWVGENSLLLGMEKGCIRVDIAPESLTWQEE